MADAARPPAATGVLAQPGLRVTGLTVGYGPVVVLRGLNLLVPAGTVGVVSGPNGAGKTTLVQAVAGLLSTRDGQIHHGAVALHGRPAHRVARAGVALVPQGRRVFGSLTVAEHLRLAQARRNDAQRSDAQRSDVQRSDVQRSDVQRSDVQRSDARRGEGQRAVQRGEGQREARRGEGQRRGGPCGEAERVLDALPALRPLLRRPARHLSGGEQQLLALARALVQRPSLLLLDEPTEGLAPSVAVTVRGLVAQLASTGVTVLLTDSDVAGDPIAGTRLFLREDT